MLSDRVEPSTKISFTENFAPDSNSKSLKLGSIGLRKRWFRNVYAFGLYFDPEQASEELKRWNTYNMDELVSNLSFYNAISGSNFEKGIKMVLARAIQGSDLRVAFEESLNPHVERYAAIFTRGHNKSNQE